MAEPGQLHRSAGMRWAGTAVWPTERGARIASTGLSAPSRPGERLLHRLALADVGLALEAAGRTILTEREARSAKAVPGRPAELLAVPACAQAVHWPDLVLVPPGGPVVAVEVELTPKSRGELRAILRAYQRARRRVVYLGAAPVVRQLQGRPGSDGQWVDGVAQEAGLLPRGEPDPGAGGLLRVRPLVLTDPDVARQVGRHATRR
ncbi:hypothetical protein HET69_40275 [Streptomyces sp. CJ_13]|uniref:hypothetical protein n=1 Tax=Streptomyces sp. CJ_13 TaxID=2724943 RepID=UPI001BDD4885|nr:hypothetical protein [Streptomyces sp. CJ_13]MBT1190051.1 hypothetical protein [Streptomyces sp. CJ_13]